MKLKGLTFIILLLAIGITTQIKAEELVFARHGDMAILDEELAKAERRNIDPKRAPQGTSEPLAVTEDHLRRIIKRVVIRNFKRKEESGPKARRDWK